MSALLIITLAWAQTDTNMIIMHHPITKSSICWWDTRARLLFSHQIQLLISHTLWNQCQLMDHCRSDDEKQNHIQVSGVNKLYHYREPYKPKTKLLRIFKSHGCQFQAYFQQTWYVCGNTYLFTGTIKLGLTQILFICSPT